MVNQIPILQIAEINLERLHKLDYNTSTSNSSKLIINRIIRMFNMLRLIIRKWWWDKNLTKLHRRVWLGIQKETCWTNKKTTITELWKHIMNFNNSLQNLIHRLRMVPGKEEIALLLILQTCFLISQHISSRRGPSWCHKQRGRHKFNSVLANCR